LKNEILNGPSVTSGGQTNGPLRRLGPQPRQATAHQRASRKINVTFHQSIDRFADFDSKGLLFCCDAGPEELLFEICGLGPEKPELADELVGDRDLEARARGEAKVFGAQLLEPHEIAVWYWSHTRPSSHSFGFKVVVRESESEG